MRKSSATFLIIGLLAIIAWFAWKVIGIVQTTADSAVSPVAQSVGALSTQVSEVLHPTPTVIPDPITIIHDVRSLARLETIQYTVEKVVTVETGQGTLGFLFGDKLLFVAHGVVIAGVDLNKLTAQDFWIENGVLNVRLPASEVFTATLDNEKSYVYNRDTGVLTHGDQNLETTARQAAEQAILDGALEDGILAQAQVNAENYLDRLLGNLGFPEVIFAQP